MNTEEEEDTYVVGLQEVSSQAVEGLLVQVEDNGDGKEPERRKTVFLLEIYRAVIDKKYLSIRKSTKLLPIRYFDAIQRIELKMNEMCLAMCL